MPESNQPNPVEEDLDPRVEVLRRLPTRRYLLTAAHGGSQNGMLVSRVQHCADEPPVVAVSVRKGHPLSPLIRDAATFGLGELRAADRLIARKFELPTELHGEDPFLGLPLVPTAETRGLPMPINTAAWAACELVRHLDIEADHELYIGRVVAGRIYVNHKSLPINGSTNGRLADVPMARHLGPVPEGHPSERSTGA